MTDTESPLKFPTDFTIKIFGLANQEFENTVLMIIHKHAPNLSNRKVSTRASANGKYLAISVTILVDSREQLDNIYRELSSSPAVLMAL